MRQKFTRKCACPSASSSYRRLLAFMRFPSRGTAAFTRVPPSRQEESSSVSSDSVSRSYTPSSSFLIPGKDFPISKWRAQKTAPVSTTTLSTDSTSIVIRALEIHRTRTEKLRKETSEKARVEREKEKSQVMPRALCIQSKRNHHRETQPPPLISKNPIAKNDDDKEEEEEALYKNKKTTTTIPLTSTATGVVAGACCIVGVAIIIISCVDTKRAI